MQIFIIKRILPLFMLTLMVFSGFSINPLTMQKSFGEETDPAIVTEPPVGDPPVVIPPIVVEQPPAANPVYPSYNNTDNSTTVDTPVKTPAETTIEPIPVPEKTPTETPIFVMALENSILTGILPNEAVTYTLNGKTLTAVINGDIVVPTIEVIKSKKAASSNVRTVILELPKSAMNIVSGIQLKIPGTLVALLDKEGIALEFSQGANTIKLEPKAFNIDSYKLFESGKELQIDLENNSQALATNLILYDEPATPLSSVFSVKATLNDGGSAPVNISPMNKGITLSTVLSTDARSNLSKDSIVMASAYNANEKDLVSIQTQYDREKGIASYNVTASGDYLLASRILTKGSALSGWLFLIPLGIVLLIIGSFYFIRNKKRALPLGDDLSSTSNKKDEPIGKFEDAD
ncbi:MAG: hypothetical protein JJE18_04860 [Eubacteriaceae bacterium]|nr:hypothetical protein [Eubacteriaceae bacterium]